MGNVGAELPLRQPARGKTTFGIARANKGDTTCCSLRLLIFQKSFHHVRTGGVAGDATRPREPAGGVCLKIFFAHLLLDLQLVFKPKSGSTRQGGQLRGWVITGFRTIAPGNTARQTVWRSRHYSVCVVYSQSCQRSAAQGNASSALLFWFFTKIESYRCGWMGKRGKQRERYHRAPREKDSGKIVYNSLDVIQKETTAMIRRIDVAERGLLWTDV